MQLENCASIDRPGSSSQPVVESKTKKRHTRGHSLQRLVQGKRPKQEEDRLNRRHANKRQHLCKGHEFSPAFGQFQLFSTEHQCDTLIRFTGTKKKQCKNSTIFTVKPHSKDAIPQDLKNIQPACETTISRVTTLEEYDKKRKKKSSDKRLTTSQNGFLTKFYVVRLLCANHHQGALFCS